MIDKELLPLAAKDIGHQHRWSDSYHHGEMRSEILVLPSEGVWFGWDPLTDDGDALRLAVKLGLDLSFEVDNVVFANGTCSEFLRSDYFAATRRAIVRAAAEIGRAMT